MEPSTQGGWRINVIFVESMKEGYSNIVILANGRFPRAGHCREILDQAQKIICCDKAADKLLRYGKVPEKIIGDLDSLSESTRSLYRDRLFKIEDQESNDLTKAVQYCVGQGYKAVSILGATGLREDHSLGNISLLLEYNNKIKARIVSDHGEFSLVESGAVLPSYPGEQVSIFSVDNQVRVSSEGLKYPLDRLQLHNWWRASLNEAKGDHFILSFESQQPLILYRLLRG
jgi:thiamine pyrophosphokinase